jgi:hypothetical protein
MIVSHQCDTDISRGASCAVVGPVVGPSPGGPGTPGNNTEGIISTEPHPPAALVPFNFNGTGSSLNPLHPSTVINDNCTLTLYDPTGKVAWSTNNTGVGPCRLVISDNGTLSVLDLGNNSAVIWTNEIEANRTGSCSPYSLSVTPTGVLVETDCNGMIIWQKPLDNSTTTGTIVGPGPTETTDKPILNNVQGPAVLRPVPGTQTAPPYAILNPNCTLTILDASGNVAWVSSPTSPGPCTLVLSPNCSLSIVDNTLGKTVWSNQVSRACGPCNVEMLSSGQFVERDCNNNTIWTAPPGEHCWRVLAASLALLPVCGAVYRPNSQLRRARRQGHLGYTTFLRFPIIGCTHICSTMARHVQAAPARLSPHRRQCHHAIMPVAILKAAQLPC